MNIDSNRTINLVYYRCFWVWVVKSLRKDERTGPYHIGHHPQDPESMFLNYLPDIKI